MLLKAEGVVQDKVEICPDPAAQQPDVMKVGRPQDRKQFQPTYGTAYDDTGEVNNFSYQKLHCASGRRLPALPDLLPGKPRPRLNLPGLGVDLLPRGEGIRAGGRLPPGPVRTSR